MRTALRVLVPVCLLVALLSWTASAQAGPLTAEQLTVDGAVSLIQEQGSESALASLRAAVHDSMYRHRNMEGMVNDVGDRTGLDAVERLEKRLAGASMPH